MWSQLAIAGGVYGITGITLKLSSQCYGPSPSLMYSLLKQKQLQLAHNCFRDETCCSVLSTSGNGSSHSTRWLGSWYSSAKHSGLQCSNLKARRSIHSHSKKTSVKASLGAQRPVCLDILGPTWPQVVKIQRIKTELPESSEII